MPALLYRGVRVFIPPTADVMTALRPGGAKAVFVQRTLDGIEPWEKHELPLETERFANLGMWPRALPVPTGARVVWGVHKGHTASAPDVSPFMVLTNVPETHDLTVELTGTPKKPVLIRAYPVDENGDGYEPPLPWMQSARSAEGGQEACFRYWRTHAFVVRRGRPLPLVEGTRSDKPPRWFRD